MQPSFFGKNHDLKHVPRKTDPLPSCARIDYGLFKSIPVGSRPIILNNMLSVLHTIRSF